MSDPTDLQALVEQIIAESNAEDAPLAKGDDATAVVARLRIAGCGPILRAIADEGEIGTDPRVFAEGAECFLATISTSLAGFLGSERRNVQPNAAKLLMRAAETVMQTPDAMHGGLPVERVQRGPRQ